MDTNGWVLQLDNGDYNLCNLFNKLIYVYEYKYYTPIEYLQLGTST